MLVWQGLTTNQNNQGKQEQQPWRLDSAQNSCPARQSPIVCAANGTVISMGQILWQDTIYEAQVRELLMDRGVGSMHIKYLSRNHNSKNQVYLAGDLSELAVLPMGEVSAVTGTSLKRKAGPPIYHALLPWNWVTPDGPSPAPFTQLVYYPQYPEVRLSGFLRSSPNAPNSLMSPAQRGYEDGRLLVFGVGVNQQTYALVLSGQSPAAQSLERFRGETGQLVTVPVQHEPLTGSRESLMRELARIHRLGWLEACELPASGGMRPCRGPRCGGHTLEAHLGVSLNGSPAPDFGEWEVKQHGVTSFERPGTGHITLFTPEPNLGGYAAEGTDWFARAYGVSTADGSRFDFTGRHMVTGTPHQKTGLELTLAGYDLSTNAVTADGFVGLVDSTGALVSGWSFAKLLKHWQTKHSHAAYVPSQSLLTLPRKYRYGNRIHLAEGTRFTLFLRAMALGAIVYDPGIKTELQENGRWKPKARSQFRINVASLSHLYDAFEEVDVLAA